MKDLHFQFDRKITKFIIKLAKLSFKSVVFYDTNKIFCFSVSAEEASIRSRVEKVLSMVQQKAEMRRARQLAKTKARSTASTPYKIPDRSKNVTSSNSDSIEKALPNSLMVTQSSVELNTATGSESVDHQMHQHCIEQVENTYVRSSKDISTGNQQEAQSASVVDMMRVSATDD